MPSIKDECTITIARFEHYPNDTPTGYCVGFSVVCNRNGKTVYRDTIVPYTATENKEDADIVNMAWEALRDNIESWLSSVINSQTVLGSTFIPT